MGGHSDVLPIPYPLLPYLRDAVDKAPGRWVFPGPDGTMRDEECNPEKILRTALKAAKLVEGYEHVCRRCKAEGRPEEAHLERHADDALRTCRACQMKLWPRALPRQMVFHDLRHPAPPGRHQPPPRAAHPAPRQHQHHHRHLRPPPDR
jgi:hypothetical protein